MHKVVEHTKSLCEMTEKLVTATKAEFEKGIDQVDTCEAGKVVDMIKDLCDAQEKLWKACYYATVVTQMEEAKEDGMEEMPDMPMSWMLPNDRAGYDSWRYSSGRYAPKGHGHYVGRHGFTPMTPGPYYPDWPYNGDMMGYPGMKSAESGQSHGNYSDASRGATTGRMGYPYDGSDMMRSEYGRAYDKFKDSRRHYTETHSEDDRKEMSKHGKEHVMEAVSAMKEIWADATPDLREQMKKSFTALINDMK